MHQVTVSGNTREELIANLSSWIAILTPPRVNAPTAVEEAAAEKKRGRPKKEAEQGQALPLPVEATGTPVPPSLAVPPTEQATPSALTFEQVKSALQGVAAQRPGDTAVTDGYKRVADILTKYGYKTVKEIKPEHFEAILGDCKK